MTKTKIVPSMTLKEIFYNYHPNYTFPSLWEYFYQSDIDNEVYFLDRFEQCISRMYINHTAIDRGRKNKVSKLQYIHWLTNDAVKKDFSSMNDKAAMMRKMYKKLKDDYDIDSNELAIDMFDKGWRVV